MNTSKFVIPLILAGRLFHSLVAETENDLEKHIVKCTGTERVFECADRVFLLCVSDKKVNVLDKYCGIGEFKKR